MRAKRRPYERRSGLSQSGSRSAASMPTTLLIDREGHEIGRLVGPANWDSPDALALIKAAIAAPA